MTPLPLQVRLTSTAVRAYRLKAERSFKSESSLVSIGYQLHRHMRGWPHRHPRQLLVACRAPHWSCSASCCAVRRARRGMHIDTGGGEGRGRGMAGMKLFCFGGNVGVELAAFRMKDFIPPHPLCSDSPRQGTTTSLPIMFRQFSLKSRRWCLEKANSPARVYGPRWMNDYPWLTLWLSC
jgi:hypothetical protein